MQGGLIGLLLASGAAAFAPLRPAMPGALHLRHGGPSDVRGGGALCVCMQSIAESSPQSGLLRGALASLRLLRYGDLSTMLHACTDQDDVMSAMRVGQRSIFFVAAPSLVKEICVDKAAAFRDREEPPEARGLTLGAYNEWKGTRKALDPAFFRRDELAAHACVAGGKAALMGQHWASRGGVVDLSQDCTALAQSVLLNILFSEDERLWELTRVSVAPKGLAQRALEEALAWLWLLSGTLVCTGRATLVCTSRGTLAWL